MYSLLLISLFSVYLILHWDIPSHTPHKISNIICYDALQAVTKDGFGCIRCPSSLSDEGKCQCPPGSVLGESIMTGIIYEFTRINLNSL